jgi:hypothetical protein
METSAQEKGPQFQHSDQARDIHSKSVPIVRTLGKEKSQQVEVGSWNMPIWNKHINRQ